MRVLSLLEVAGGYSIIGAESLGHRDLGPKSSLEQEIEALP